MNLLPLAVTQLVLVCFFLHLFEPTGETTPPRTDIRHPRAVNGAALVIAPVVEISPTDLRIDGTVIAGGGELGDQLATTKRNHPLLHPNGRFEGRVLVSADRDVPWRRLREVLAAAEKNDYRLIDFAVVKSTW